MESEHFIVFPLLETSFILLVAAESWNYWCIETTIWSIVNKCCSRILLELHDNQFHNQTFITTGFAYSISPGIHVAYVNTCQYCRHIDKYRC
jgi:hypothetical protein